MAAEGGVHYLPLEECLMQRGLVEDLYPPNKDRCDTAIGREGVTAVVCTGSRYRVLVCSARLYACKAR